MSSGLKIGHTGITWGIPGDVETAIKDTADLGYLGFETFSLTILEWNNERGGYRQLVERYGIPTVAAYCYKKWIDPNLVRAEVQEAKQEAEAFKALPGSETFVLQAGPRVEGGLSREQFERMATAMEEVGAHCRELGLSVGLHPHTGTAVESRADIDAALERLDPALVGFAPDTGQIAKGGSDILEMLRTHRHRITHVHLKDWCGRFERDENGREIDPTGYVGYEPIGNGVLPMPEILDILDGLNVWINVELDGTRRSPRPPREAAAMSRRYLGRILGDRIAWRA